MRILISILSCFLFLAAIPARGSTILIGTMADWAATPSQVAGDKTFTYLSSSGGWDLNEFLYLAANNALASHSLGILIADYTGPATLTLSYRIDIAGPFVFASVALDQDHTGDNVTTYKDVFGSEEDWLANTTPGSGTLAALVAVNESVPGDLPLPPLQSLWIRDTIMLDATGSVLSVSNTYVQVVPEPGTYALGGAGIAVVAARSLRRRAARAGKAG